MHGIILKIKIWALLISTFSFLFISYKRLVPLMGAKLNGWSIIEQMLASTWTSFHLKYSCFVSLCPHPNPNIHWKDNTSVVWKPEKKPSRNASKHEPHILKLADLLKCWTWTQPDPKLEQKATQSCMQAQAKIWENVCGNKPLGLTLTLTLTPTRSPA